MLRIAFVQMRVHTAHVGIWLIASVNDSPLDCCAAAAVAAPCSIEAARTVDTPYRNRISRRGWRRWRELVFCSQKI